MFEVKCLCDDKKLHVVMRALDGLAYNVEVIPVNNAQVSNGKVEEKKQKAKPDVWSRLVKSIHGRRKGAILRFAELGEILTGVGGNGASRSAYVSRLLREEIVKKGKERGTYERI